VHETRQLSLGVSSLTLALTSHGRSLSCRGMPPRRVMVCGKLILLAMIIGTCANFHLASAQEGYWTQGSSTPQATRPPVRRVTSTRFMNATGSSLLGATEQNPPLLSPLLVGFGILGGLGGWDGDVHPHDKTLAAYHPANESAYSNGDPHLTEYTTSDLQGVHSTSCTSTWASCQGHHVRGIMSWASCQGHHVRGIMSWASCYGHPVMGIEKPTLTSSGPVHSRGYAADRQPGAIRPSTAQKACCVLLLPSELEFHGAFPSVAATSRDMVGDYAPFPSHEPRKDVH
jgi:hypothetical protein